MKATDRKALHQVIVKVLQCMNLRDVVNTMPTADLVQQVKKGLTDNRHDRTLDMVGTVLDGRVKELQDFIAVNAGDKTHTQVAEELSSELKAAIAELAANTEDLKRLQS